ncbi:hypothetical protein H312_00633 [Anncaliia algerae PRA339]|uniref:Derlin n=1 Tax=Anncaliia algerae PRA339 TaxID=1288291 RepID=A0A059F4E2_9MICR|nr:hypothetical protein H312_00633 [Anncaliia algerae PRA339]
MTENIFTSFIANTPPMTRILGTLTVITSLLIYLEIVSSYQLMLNFKSNELYRYITSLFYFGQPNFDTILHLIFMFRYSKMLEESYIYTSDYFFFLISVIFMIYICAFLFNIIILGPILSSVITYVWTRKNPYAQLQLFGFVVFPAFYLPFVIPFFSYITERRILKGEIIGIGIGHVYYFFKFVFPTFGIDIFKTPYFLKRLFNEVEQSNNVINEVEEQQPEVNVSDDALTNSNEIIEELEEESPFEEEIEEILKNNINKEINNKEIINKEIINKETINKEINDKYYESNEVINENINDNSSEENNSENEEIKRRNQK